MTIRFACPHCGRDIKVRDEAVGQTGKCNSCGKQITVPEAWDPPVVATPVPSRAKPNQVARSEVLSPALGQQPLAVQVNVQQPSRAAHSLGIAAIVLGCLSFPISWIPVIGAIGLPLSGLGLLLGLIGVLISIFRRGSGVGYSIAGTAICGLALLIAGTITSFLFSVL